MGSLGLYSLTLFGNLLYLITKHVDLTQLIEELPMDNKKTYSKPEITEVGKLNEVILAAGLTFDVDNVYIQNGVQYATFNPVMST